MQPIYILIAGIAVGRTLSSFLTPPPSPTRNQQFL